MKDEFPECADFLQMHGSDWKLAYNFFRIIKLNRKIVFRMREFIFFSHNLRVHNTGMLLGNCKRHRMLNSDHQLIFFQLFPFYNFLTSKNDHC